MSYFRELPNLFIQSPFKERNSSNEYILVKNIFRRMKLRDDLQNVLTLFEKYNIRDGFRPEQVAEEVYGSVEYDFVVLISSGIINVRHEWPISDRELYKYAEDKYGVHLNAIRHYVTTEVKDADGRLILPKGKVVDQGFTIPDPNSPLQDLDPTVAVTNWLVETRKNNKKRAIQVLRPQYVNQLIDDANDILAYQESSQFTEDGGKIAFNDLI